ncbi:M67 family metallopeptidase [Qipengyuania vesicularis]|uniref:M67 family metallopeptidase n=1 Tax=Qipengyuania vesicularis TaxID=2867232 RepID=UPI001C86E7BE|nr:M67 family metallopeptidase [Qipengyuania vesicularis]MBX7527561.1 M67 family metallopeptidase [Qipengyuania vesicularis]
MTLEVSSQLLETLLAEAAAAHPRECCGILLGEGERVETSLPAKNIHPAPENHFEIDPQVLIDAHRDARAGGPQVVGYYHSHPNGLLEPSATDEATAAGDGTIWAIIAAGRVTLWRSGDAGFAALPYAVSAR